VRIEPAASLHGDLAVPGVKGICQRAALVGAIADGESVVRGFGHAADTDAALDAVQDLGADVREDAEGTIRIQGRGLRGLVPPHEPIDCRNAGTVMRLLAGIVGGHGGRCTLVGDESLSSRPMERIAVPLRAMGAAVETTDGHAPVTIEGGALHGIRYELPVASAQVKSCILLAGLYADSPTTVFEPRGTRDHTERMLSSLGVRMQRSGREVRVWPVNRLPPLDLTISGDFSSAAPFVVAATLLAGSEIRIHDVNLNPTRTAFLDVLERMGARITVFDRHAVSGEPVGSLEVRAAQLTATNIGPDEVPNLVDELPLFALAAGLARGESVVRGAEELRVKESDRIETVTTLLRTLGVHIEARHDGFRVRGVPSRPRGGGVVDASGDHRIAMLAGVAGLVSREGAELKDPECVAVSFPDFFGMLESLAQEPAPR